MPDTVTIEVAANAGACFGVKRALELARDAANATPPVHTLGPLIHNPIVVADLEACGVGVANTLDEAVSGTLVLRSHGTAPEVIDAARVRGFEVVDATCPFVAKVQQQARALADEGYAVVIIGEKGHAEVESIRAWGGDAVVAVADEPDKLPEELPSRLGVVVQTTQSRQRVDAVLDELQRRGADLLVKDTVCHATQERQASASTLSAKSDVMLVVGGHNSGNTRRLFEICSESCARSHQLESPEEIERCWFEDAASVGITAGASTPQEHIDAVVARIAALVQAMGKDPVLSGASL